MRFLIINPSQFGYTAGYLYYSKYLIKKGHIVEYLCLDDFLPKVELNGIIVHYVSRHNNFENERIAFLKAIWRFDFSSYNAVLLTHRRFAFLYRLFGVPRSAILDIRTGDLSENLIKRTLWNKMIKLDTLFFRHSTILSESLRDLLKINVRKNTILPLGADIISDQEKDFNSLNFIYLGTLHKRHIDKTIAAIYLFKIENPEVSLRYDIIGFGTPSEEGQIIHSIAKYNLNQEVFFHGRKNHSDLKPFFDKSNIGFSFIPLTPYYDIQPPTKTFEYILSGMVCIATSTLENKKIINETNGILCNDDINSVLSAIKFYYNNRMMYNSSLIRNSLSNFLWERVISEVLEPCLINNPIK